MASTGVIFAWPLKIGQICQDCIYVGLTSKKGQYLIGYMDQLWKGVEFMGLEHPLELLLEALKIYLS